MEKIWQEKQNICSEQHSICSVQKSIICSTQKGITQFDPVQLLLFKQKRTITFLFKIFLSELEDMVDNGLIGEDYFKKQRKFILDYGNSAIREFEDELNKYDIKTKGR